MFPDFNKFGAGIDELVELFKRIANALERIAIALENEGENQDERIKPNESGYGFHTDG